MTTRAQWSEGDMYTVRNRSPFFSDLIAEEYDLGKTFYYSRSEKKNNRSYGKNIQ